MIKQFALVSTTLLLFVAGCASTTYTIRTNEDSPNDIFLVFSKRANAEPGNKFVVYRTRTMSAPNTNSGGHQHGGGHGGGSHTMREEIGKVEIIEVLGETYARVKVLSGTIENGAHAQKLDE
jgi:hypothetical protein